MLVQRRGGGRRDQLARERLRQPIELEHGQPCEVVGVVGLALREQEDDRLRLQAPGQERQDLRRRRVKPLGIVDEAEQRHVLGGAGQQAEHREPDEEAIGARAQAQPERRRKRLLLRRRQQLKTAQEPCAELVQAREGKLHLRFHAGRADDPPAGGPLRRVLEQRGLSDPGLPAQHQHRALTARPIRHEAIQPRPLGGATGEHR
jgi:hypothetical protein